MKTFMKWLLCFGVLSTFYYTALTDAGTAGTGLPYRADLLLYPVSALLIILNRSEAKTPDSLSRKKAHIILGLCAAYIFFCIFSTALAAAFLGIQPNRLGLTHLWDHVGFLLTATAVYQICLRSEKWRARVSWALILTPFISAFLLTLWFIDQPLCDLIVYQILQIPLGQTFLSLDGRFAGLAANPAYMQDMCIVSSGFIWIAMIYCIKERRRLSLLFLSVFLAADVIMLVWTGTRSGMIAFPVMLLMGGYIVASQRSVTHVFGGLGVLSVLVFIVLSVMPIESKTSILSRADDDDRSENWSYYISLAPSLPFGAGLSYEETYMPPMMMAYRNNRLPPHNEFLCAWMVAGLPGECMLVLIMILTQLWSYRGLRYSISRGPNDMSNVIGAGALLSSAGFWIDHVFLDTPFNSIHFAVLLGIILSDKNFGMQAPRVGDRILSMRRRVV